MTSTRDRGHWSGLLIAPEAERLPARPGAVAEALADTGASLLPRGAGMTYGDTNANSGGALVTSERLARILDVDREAGHATVESGVTLGALLDAVRPLGWTVAACPGTARVTVGGMIAHDVHGKDHARAGSFGGWVEEVTLARSDREGPRTCSRADDPGLFRATIGGLGLTGFIERARIRLTPFHGRCLRVERVRCRGVEAALARLRGDGPPDHGYVWVDGRSLRSARARCVVVRAWRTGAGQPAPGRGAGAEALLGLASRVAPRIALTAPAVRAANRVFHLSAARPGSARSTREVDVDHVLFPQDRAGLSNRIHGRRGVRAHHSIVRSTAGLDAALGRLARPDGAPPMVVLKAFGDHAPEGLLSFGGPGVSIATGDADRGERTRRMLDDLEDVVLADGGQIYPAKDSRMGPAAFARSFPRAAEFARHVDPRFESNFWRRVRPRER